MVVANHPIKNLWMPLIGIPIGGLLWSVATVVINADQVAEAGLPLHLAFLFVLAGGMAQIVALWIGFSAIVWAMFRGFGGQLALLRVLRIISKAFWPLWIGAPAMAFWLSGGQYQTSLSALASCIGLFGFFTLTVQALAKETGWPKVRAFAALSTAVIFISSFIYLTL